MSSTGLWAEDQGSRPHQRVRRTSMQAAKLSEEDGVSSSQPPELEDKSSQAKTAKSGIYMLVSRDDAVQRLVLLGVVLLVVVALGSSIIFPSLLLHEKFMLQHLVLLLALLLSAVLVPVQTLHRIMNFCRACMHGRDSRLVKWGPHEWVLDSGAWNHHTSNQALLLEGGDFQSQEMDNKDAPSSGDDASANGPHVQGRGSVRTDCFDFPGVHYVVGDDTRNVVSVSQLARDHGLVTVFEPTSCHVKEKTTGKIVGKGRLRNGMYILDSLHIVGQHIRDGGASGGDRHDGADGGGDSTAEGRGGGGRDGRGREGGTGARNQEESSGSGAAEGDVNELNEEGEGGDEKENEEMDENDEDEIKDIGEINGKGENEDDEKRGGQNSGQLSSRPYTGFRLSPFGCILCIITACISRPYKIWGAGVAVLGFHLLKTSTMQSTICKLKQIGGSLFRGTSGDRESTEEEKTRGAHLQELSHQEHNKRLFGLSRFDATTDPTGYRRRHLPAGAFPASSTNAARREEFLVDSGASFHTTWNEWILIPYHKYLKDHTEPPTRSFGGIIGSIAVTRSGYLSGDKIKLDGVLLAPESRMNLVSVGQLSIQYEVKVEMDDEGVIIKKKQNGVQIGGGKMLNNHQYVLEYFQPPEGLFARSPTPHFKIFGTRRPGPAHINTVPCPARSTTTEETGADSEETGAGRESRAVRMRRPNTLITGPTWSR